MSDNKKRKEFRFFWEEPSEKAEKRMKSEHEFRFTFPRFEFPEIRNTVPVNIGQTDREIIVRAELPGFKKNEINLNVTENSVEIRAAKKEEKIEKTEKMFRRERSANAVNKMFTLPEKVDADKTEAKLEDDVLTLILPKLYPKKKKKKRIEVE